jgi:RNA recognition motif-containing protein
MSKKLFVGGLPYSVSSSQLEEIFSKFGKVISCDVINDRYSGQSKGFGFVEMQKDEEADEAIKKLNDTQLEGRRIAVNVARPREDRPRFDSRGGGPGRGGRRPGRRGYR